MIEDPRRLGRGLAALLGESDGDDHGVGPSRERQREVPIENLAPNRFQPRQTFDEEALAELTASVRERGVLQPILVRRGALAGTYEIIAGERRWRAAQRAQLHQVPVVIKEMTDAEALEVALIENIQRRDLDAIEEALGYQRLIAEFGHTQEKVGQLVNKSRAVVANRLRLLALPPEVQQLLRDRKLDEGHARALIGTADPLALANRIVAEGMTARDAEGLAAGNKAGSTKGGRADKSSRAVKDADTAALERDLSTALGLRVTVKHRGAGGDVSVAYASLEQLDELCRVLSAGRRILVDQDEDLLSGPPDPSLIASELAQLK